MPATYLTVNVDRIAGVCVLTLSGELDCVTAAEFETRARSAMDDQVERLVLDLAELTFVDCGGARAIGAVSRAAPAGCPVIVRSLRPSARRLLDLLGVNPEDPRRDDARYCDECGSTFTPRREHARFCSSHCRIVWNRRHASGNAAGMSALDWSITAMRDSAGRLSLIRAEDQPRAVAAISEAVWWVTIVDATLVRYHSGCYDGVLERQHPADRQLIENTLGGLRFVRNRMGQYLDPADFVHCGRGGPRDADGHITTWTWKPVPQPVLQSLLPRAQAWEMTRYRAYQAQLAGHSVGEIFGRAVTFLNLVEASAHAAPASPR